MTSWDFFEKPAAVITQQKKTLFEIKFNTRIVENNELAESKFNELVILDLVSTLILGPPTKGDFCFQFF